MTRKSRSDDELPISPPSHISTSLFISQNCLFLRRGTMLRDKNGNTFFFSSFLFLFARISLQAGRKVGKKVRRIQFFPFFTLPVFTGIRESRLDITPEMSPRNESTPRANRSSVHFQTMDRCF